MEIKFTPPDGEPLETYIMSCISAFRTLKNGGEYKTYEIYCKEFIEQYSEMSYDDFKKQALKQLNYK